MRILSLLVLLMLAPLASADSVPSTLPDRSPSLSAAPTAVWNTELVVAHGGSAAPEVAVDSKSRPHILACPPGEVWYAVRDAMGWSGDLVTTTIGGGICGNLALDGGDVPYIAFSIPPTWDPSRFYLAIGGGAAWKFLERPREGADMVVDASGSAHLVFAVRTSSTNWSVRSSSLLNGQWLQEDVETFVHGDPFLGPSWGSLALDALDRPHLLYYDSPRGDVRYAFRDAAGWHVEIVEHIGFIGTAGRQGSMALDSRGTPHVAYFVRTDDPYGEVRYGNRTSSGWTREVVSAVQSFAPSLALGPDDTPKVAFQRLVWIDRPNIIYELDQVYATRLGGGWSEETVFDGFWDNTIPRGQLPQFPALVADACGNPHLAFYISWWEGLDGSRSGVYYASKGQPCDPASDEPFQMKQEAIQRIKSLKERALDRPDMRFAESLDAAERSVWKSLGYANPFKPIGVTATASAGVSIAGNGHDRVDLVLGPSWTPRLNGYDAIHVTWANTEVTTVDLPNGWPRRPLRYHDEVWVDAWEQDLSISSNRDWRTGQATLTVRARDASLGFALSLDADPVATLSFTYNVRPWWIDGSHLDPKQSLKVFDLERRAVECLITSGARNGGDDDSDDDGDRDGGVGVLHGDDDREGRGGCRHRDRDDEDADHDEGDEDERRSRDARTPRCRLTPRLWTDAERAELDAACAAIANLLVAADDGLARTALKDAEGTAVKDPRNQGRVDREIGKAERALARGKEAWDRHAYGDAIRQFEEAWEHAQRAIRLAGR